MNQFTFRVIESLCREQYFCKHSCRCKCTLDVNCRHEVDVNLSCWNVTQISCYPHLFVCRMIYLIHSQWMRSYYPPWVMSQCRMSHCQATDTGLPLGYSSSSMSPRSQVFMQLLTTESLHFILPVYSTVCLAMQKAFDCWTSLKCLTFSKPMRRLYEDNGPIRVREIWHRFDLVTRHANCTDCHCSPRTQTQKWSKP